MRPSTAFLLLSACLLVGCSKPKLSPVEKPTAKKNLGTEWTLVEAEPPALMPWIGELGLIACVDASGSINSTDFPQLPVKWEIDGVAIDHKIGTDYSQSLSFSNRSVTTKWNQKIKEKSVAIEVTSEPIIAGFKQQWKFSCDRPIAVNAANYGDLQNKPSGIDPSGTTFIGSSTFKMVLGGDVSGLFLTIKKVDIEIDGPLEDQQAVRSFIYYLQTLYGFGKQTYSPMGGTNDVFADRTFWDADVWLLPALALVEPHVAGSIAHLRSQQANSKLYDEWVKQGRPTATRKTTEPDLGLASMAKAKPIKYPWQAGPNGEELSTQPTRFAEHVSGDVAWGASFAADLGLISNEQTKKFVDGVAAYYLHRATLGNDQKVGIEDTVSVDEWHAGNDDLYTNAIADWVIRESLGSEVWPADAMRFPNDYGGLLAYEGDPRKAYQQAAAQLVLWPLEKEGLVGDPIQFLDRFAGKNAPTGPAMSLSVDALIRARYGNADQALDEWRESWKRYTDGNPFLLFSEKPNQPDRTYFGTGAAGCLNTVVYGFVGARIVEDASQDKAKIKIANDKWLVFRPNLPSDWKKLTLRGITVMNKKYDVTCIGRTATIKVAGT